jgi:hypothetical protein
MKARLKWGSRGFIDGDDERDHVGPVRDRYGSKRQHENQDHHIEGPFILAVVAAEIAGKMMWNEIVNANWIRDRRSAASSIAIFPKRHASAATLNPG